MYLLKRDEAPDLLALVYGRFTQGEGEESVGFDTLDLEGGESVARGVGVVRLYWLHKPG